jgi:hypothetical protein
MHSKIILYTCKYRTNFEKLFEGPLADYYHGLVEPQVVENQWNFVELVTKEKPVQKFYMVCDFSMWNNLSQVSKMDHCKILIFHISDVLG